MLRRISVAILVLIGLYALLQPMLFPEMGKDEDHTMEPNRQTPSTRAESSSTKNIGDDASHDVQAFDDIV